MKLQETATKVLVDPKWKAMWYFTNSLWSGITLYLLSSFGYVFWSPKLALILGFFVPLVVYGAKEGLGLYRYKRNLGDFWYMGQHYKQGLGLFENELWEKALVHFEEVLKVGPDHKRALYYSAICHERLQNWDEMESRCRRYLEQNPNDVEVQSMLRRAGQNP
ncbi:MAG: hypothetical protein EAX95_04680 [Candidatus Thorarchaeota archaeon]|nr:hypothetical protein [Candidatus Thorarchaeota archaeon]